MAILLVLMTTIPLMDTAVAQDSEQTSDDEEYKDGKHDGKSCPFKNKTASVNLLPNL